MAGFGAVFVGGTATIDLEGSGTGAFQEQGLTFGEIGDMNDFIS